MRIIHFGDLHLWSMQLPLTDLYPKRLLGLGNLLIKRRAAFPPAYGEAVLNDLLSQDAELVIFSGDMTTTALEVEFERAARAFTPLREKWSENFFCIPGNHDRYTPGAIKNRLYEKYFPYGVMDDHIKLHRSDLGLDIIGFDCSRPWLFRSNGQLNPALPDRLRETFASLDPGRPKLLVGHYPYSAPPDVEISWQHGLLHSEVLDGLIAELQPTLYFHGHKHQRWLHRSPTSPQTLCVNSGASGMKSSAANKNAGYMILDVDDSGAAVKVTARNLIPGSETTFEEHDLAVPGC